MLKNKLFAGAVLALAMFAIVGVSQVSAESTVRVGSRGVDVMAVQTAVGAMPVDGAFGPITKAKVQAFQVAHNLVADGVVGANTWAAIHALGPSGTGTVDLCPNGNTVASSCTVPPAGATGPLCPNGMTVASNCATNGTSTGALAGTFGEISDINQLSQYSNEEVGDGSNDVKVMGFDLTASKDGDVSVNSIKLTFDSASNGATESDRIADYITSVSVWDEGTKVATVDAADFTKESTGVYSKTIALSNAVVKADSTVKFYVSVDAVNNLDSGDITADSWSVGINNIRYVDGSGVTTTETAAIPATILWDSAGDGVAISFVSFSASADTELKISLDSTPASQVVKVSTANNTDDVTLLKGKMKVNGTSNVWLDEVPFLFTTNATNVDGVTPTVYLTIDGKTFSESMTATAETTEAITFNNLDLTLTAGSTYAFTVSADINDIEASSFDEGDTLKAELTTTNRAAMVVENTSGDSLTDGTERTGSAIGETQSFRSAGASIALVGTPTAVLSHAGDISNTSDSDQGTFSFTFDVTASGSDVYVDGTKPVEDGATTASGVTVIGTDTYIDSSITSSTGATLSGDINVDARFLVADGDTERFTITYVTKPGIGGTGLFTVSVSNIRYALTDVSATTSYTFNLDNFKTPALNMQYDAS